MIQRNEVMNILIDSCPSFEKKRKEQLKDIWDRESDSILYTDFSEFARHLTELVKNQDYAEFTDVFGKIEYLLQEGDSFINEAIVVGLLEDFQNGLISSGYELDLIEVYLLPETKKGWYEVIEFWNQAPYLMKIKKIKLIRILLLSIVILLFVGYLIGVIAGEIIFMIMFMCIGCNQLITELFFCSSTKQLKVKSISIGIFFILFSIFMLAILVGKLN